MTNYEFFYEGTPGPLDPIYTSAPYRVLFSELSAPTDIRTANAIKDASDNLNTGIKNIEISAIDPRIIDSIPKEHFKELNRMAKLVGAELSLHGPMIEPTGITEHGWQKMNQEAAKRQMWSAIERSHDLNPKGNIPVTFHTTIIGLPPAEFKVKEKVKEGGEEVVKEVTKSVLLVDPNGNLTQIKEEPRYFPTAETKESEIGKLVPFDPEKEIERINEEVWLRQLENLNFSARRGEETLQQTERILKDSKIDIDFSEVDENAWKEVKEKHPEFEVFKQIEKELTHGSIFLRDAYLNLKKEYDLIYKTASGEEKEKLDAYAREIAPRIKEFEHIELNPKKLTEFAETIGEGVKVLGDIKPKKLLIPLKDFAIEKCADTVSDLAVESYKKFGSTAPIISLENHPAGMSILTRADEIREVIKKARDEFVEKAVKQGIGKSDAKSASEKLIGATWDVGHINMLRRYGYDKADIIKETETIAPFVKHVHLSDNFGFEHTELPMGMGNVPIKEILKKLGQEGFEGKKVIEAGDWWQHFSPGGKQNPPLMPTLQALGSPLYPMYMQPAWTQVYDTRGGYFAGYGTISPEIHHSLYGAGFSSLPMELGGQIPGKESRQTGTPME